MRIRLLLITLFILPAVVQAQTAKSVVILPERDSEFTEQDILPTQNVLNRRSNTSSFQITEHFRTNPGVAFLGSVILPGSSQAMNRNWIRAGLFAAIETAAIILAVDHYNRAVSLENRYEREADQNWSVVQYAQWLVEYHDVHNLSNPYIDDLRNEVSGLTPAFDTDVDWKAVDITVLRNSERRTRYMTTDDQSANRFSHTLPAYGSQQYYELIAKYYQYQAGWRDYHDFHDQLGHTGDQYNSRYLFDRNGAYASSLFWQFAEHADRFNNLYRTSRSFQMIILVNHVASAFDALFTVQLKQNRIEATPSMTPGRQISMTIRF